MLTLTFLIFTIWEPFKKDGDFVGVGRQNLVVFIVFGVSPWERLREHCTGVDMATRPLLKRSSALQQIF